MAVAPSTGGTGVYEPFEVPVPDGVLRGGRWGTGPQVVLGVHGVTGNHLHLGAVAARLGDDVTLVAVDLRGRGASRDVVGASGMAAHADDQAAVLAHLGIDRAMVLGHSMGGFVGVVLAHRHPERVERLVLVDGGLPLTDDLLPPGADPVAVARALLGTSLDRLSMTFPSPEAYLDLWRAHPAFAQGWSTAAQAALTYDLVGEPPQLRSSVREASVLADFADQLTGDDVGRAVAGLVHPTRFLAAPRGLQDQVPPLYPAERLALWQHRLPALVVEVVPDVNHYTIMLSERGAAAVVATLAAGGKRGVLG